MNTLIVENITKQYRGKKVVKGISAFLNGGEVVGLLGPNGAGKTTSFYMIVGLISNDQGNILLNGKNIASFPMHARAKMGIGYLPQEASIFRKLSVADNILAVLQAQESMSVSQQENRLEELLNELHIKHLRHEIGMSLSGGERRRVEIARTLATRPHFVLLDEPFAGVDPISVIDIQRIIEYLKTIGIGVLITDHNVRETLGICERAYIVNQGEIIAEGVPEDILNNDEVREVYLGHHFRL